MPTAYEGNQPYIFISYAHADKEEVLRYVDALEQCGFRIWFDGGVEAGSEWPEYIANHLAGSACVLAFISTKFVESRNCRSELVLAQNLGIEQLNVHIEKFELPLGIQMQLGLNQAMWRENFTTEKAFVEELCKARMLQSCRGDAPAKPADAPKAAPVSQKATKKAAKADTIPAPEKIKRGCKALCWLGSLLELAYAPLSVYAMIWMFRIDSSGWWMFANMIILHTAIALLNRAFFAPMRKKIKAGNFDKEAISNSAMIITGIVILATLISIIAGAVNIPMDANFFLRLLTTLGLNVVPFVVAGLISMFLSD